MTDFEIGWTAGIIDGEGCIGVYDHRTKSGNQFRLVVRVDMVSKTAIDKLHSLWGGSVSWKKKSPPARNQWAWFTSSCTAARILERILPHLIEKKNQAEAALVFQETKKRGYFDRGRGQRTPPAILEYRQSLSDQLKQMKKEVA